VGGALVSADVSLRLGAGLPNRAGQAPVERLLRGHRVRNAPRSPPQGVTAALSQAMAIPGERTAAMIVKQVVADRTGRGGKDLALAVAVGAVGRPLRRTGRCHATGTGDPADARANPDALGWKLRIHAYLL
jgi:hypothetical protein